MVSEFLCCKSMEFFSQSLFCKARSIFAYLYSLLLWASKFPSSIQIPPHQWRLKTLIPSLQDPNRGSSVVSSSKLLKLPPYIAALALPSAIDDLIGTDSGVCLSSKEEETEKVVDHKQTTMKLCVMAKNNQRREFPPAIPLLAQTGNLSGRMPWVLTRQYVNGRLILQEVRVKHHEYFQAQRENGRLILNLVPMDDVTSFIHQKTEEIEFEEKEEDCVADWEQEVEEEEEEEEEDCIIAEKEDISILKSRMEKGIVSEWSSLCRIHSKGDGEEEERKYYGQPLSSSLPPITSVM